MSPAPRGSTKKTYLFVITSLLLLLVMFAKCFLSTATLFPSSF